MLPPSSAQKYYHKGTLVQNVVGPSSGHDQVIFSVFSKSVPRSPGVLSVVGKLVCTMSPVPNPTFTVWLCIYILT